MLNLSLFADRLNELMFDKNVNAPTLAKELGVDRTTVTRYLTGNKIPSVKNVVLLADYFLCTTDFLLGLTDENDANKFKSSKPFSEQLQFLLEHFKTTKYRMQKQTQIPESAIYNWQRGDYSPTIDNVIKIAEYFGCSVDFVLGRED